MSTPRGAVRLYARLLALYPKSHRLEYGSDMVQLFADRYRDERPGGDVFRFVRFWGGMVGDLLKTALTERTGSVVSSFKQSWWKWAIGAFAAIQVAFAVDAIVYLVGGAPAAPEKTLMNAFVPMTGAVVLIIGLRLMARRPRAAAALLVVGLIPVAGTGVVFWWFPPMWAVSVLGVYLITKVFMETGRITRASAAAA